MKVEQLDPKVVLKKAKAALKEKQQEVAAAKKAITDTVREILVGLTEKEVKAGEAHTISDNPAPDAKKYGVVEYWVRMGPADLESLIKSQPKGVIKTQAEFPAYVMKELEALKQRRKDEKAS